MRPTPPVLNSPGSDTVRAGTRVRFPIVATGTPAPIITLGPGAPASLRVVSLDGLPTLVGLIEDTADFSFSIIAKNEAGTATQAFTLVVTARSTHPSTTTTIPTTTTSATTTSTTTSPHDYHHDHVDHDDHDNDRPEAVHLVRHLYRVIF